MIQPLMFSAAVVGVAVAFVGVLQSLAGNGKVLWSYELLYGGVPFGPFVNKNNAAGFLVACGAGAIFFTAAHFIEWQRLNRPVGFSLSDREDRHSRKSKGVSLNPIKPLMNLLAGLETQHLYTFAALITIVAGTFLSLSRGGAVSIVIAMTVAVALIAISHRWVLALAALVIVAGVSLTVYVEQADAVASRISTLAEIDDSSSPRLLHWQDAMPYYEAYWQTGSGLGTYGNAYPEFQTMPFKGKFQHAENVYLETLAELGWFGLSILVLTVITVLYHSIVLFRRADSFDRALGVAGIFLIVGQVCAAALDFGIYQPANFTVVAILLGAVVGRATTPVKKKRKSTDASSETIRTESKSSRWLSISRLLATLVLVCVVAGCALSFRQSVAVESVRQARRNIRFHLNSMGTDFRSIAEAQKLLLNAKEIRPDDWKVSYNLGETYLFQHRQQLTDFVIEDIRAERLAFLKAEQDKLPPEIERTEIAPPEVVRSDSSDLESTLPTYSEYWNTSSVTNLHRLLRLSQRTNPQEYLELRKDPRIVTENLKTAYEYFRLAESQFSNAPQPTYRMAQMSTIFEPVESNNEIESKYIDRALAMSKGNTAMAFDCGLLSLNSGNKPKAIELWRDCLARSRRFERQIIQFCVADLSYKSFFEEVLPQNPYELLKISRKYFSSPDLNLPNELLLVHTGRLVEQQIQEPEERFAMLGKVHFQAGEFALAASNFRKAIELTPDQFEWRLEFANSLRAIGEYDEAIKELKICELESPEIRTKISRLIKAVQRERAKPKPKPEAAVPSDAVNASSEVSTSTE